MLALLLCLLASICSSGCGPGRADDPSESVVDLAGKLAWPLDFSKSLIDTLERGESLFLSLTRRGVAPPYCWQMIEATREVDHLARNYPGEHYELRVSPGGVPLELRYTRLDGSTVVVRGPGRSYRSHRVGQPSERALMAAGGSIATSLYEAFLEAGLRPALVLQFADIFAWSIDFLTECRKGDRFRVVFTRESKPFSTEILAASYRQTDSTVVAVSLMDAQGRMSYYTPDGTNLRKAFLRSPLNYRRISSRFSYSRLHPILKIHRPHLGVDYAAPIGTPVVTVADGKVVYAGWKGGYGRYVKVKHAGGCYTSYGHLSRFGREIRKGVTVVQGQVIGYVGSSGLSTGPHLDYRVEMQGRHVNPLRMSVPPAPPVEQGKMPEFRTRTAWLQIGLAGAPPDGVCKLGQEWERWAGGT